MTEAGTPPLQPIITSEDMPSANERELKQNDIVGFRRDVLTDADEANFGGAIIGEVKLGGFSDANEHYDPAGVSVVSVNNPETESYKRLAAMGTEAGAHPSDVILLASGSEGGTVAAAFLTPGKSYNLGRNTAGSMKIRWFPYGGHEKMPDGWTPFADNHSVSRNHALITHGPKKVNISSLTESKTFAKSDVFDGSPFAPN